jgi:hypothetical protein
VYLELQQRRENGDRQVDVLTRHGHLAVHVIYASRCSGDSTDDVRGKQIYNRRSRGAHFLERMQLHGRGTGKGSSRTV